MFADQGYLSQSLLERLWQQGLHWVTGIRCNRKNDLLPLLDKVLLRKHLGIETLLAKLKSSQGLEQTGHRSPVNALAPFSHVWWPLPWPRPRSISATLAFPTPSRTSQATPDLIPNWVYCSPCRRKRRFSRGSQDDSLLPISLWGWIPASAGMTGRGGCGMTTWRLDNDGKDTVLRLPSISLGNVSPEPEFWIRKPKENHLSLTCGAWGRDLLPRGMPSHHKTSVRFPILPCPSHTFHRHSRASGNPLPVMTPHSLHSAPPGGQRQGAGDRTTPERLVFLAPGSSIDSRWRGNDEGGTAMAGWGQWFRWGSRDFSWPLIQNSGSGSLLGAGTSPCNNPGFHRGRP